ncbi:MAG: hypothetical protein QY330_04340 [Candidatus Dojkabacteria bacterium]|nr:MAG: hypothetical protein QY330_04340 [Candidatus Dojkabacteria bacterium]
MEKPDILVFREKRWFQQFIGKEYVIYHRPLSKGQSELHRELTASHAIMKSRQSEDGEKEKFVIYEIFPHEFHQYCQAEIDKLSECRKSQAIQTKELLDLLAADFIQHQNTAPLVNEEILGSYKANPKFAADSPSNSRHRLKFNATMRQLELQGYFRITNFELDVFATEKPLSPEKAHELEKKPDHKTKTDYLPAAYSNYKIKYLREFSEYVRNGYGKETVEIEFDPESGEIWYDGKSRSVVGKTSHSYKVIAEFALGKSSVEIKQLFPVQNDSDFRHELAKEVRRKMGLSAQQLRNKDGNFILQNVSVAPKK